MKKIKISDHHFYNADLLYRDAGYSSLNEFIEHLIEKATADSEKKITSRDIEENKEIEKNLKGLGYMS